MSIELKSEVFTPARYIREPLPVMNVRFNSRNADFVIKSSASDFEDMAVSFHVGPIAMHIRADEAAALARALMACAEHYNAALANVGSAS
jgi:hypothetical protein